MLEVGRGCGRVMFSKNLVLSFVFLAPCSGFAQVRSPQGTNAPVAEGDLPVKRVVLYKSGVGYFEHLGRVHNTQDVTIAFTPGQLNDALKSLTVLDLGGGRVTGVTYSSTAPVERQLGELRLPAGDKTTLTDFLGALRGAKVEIRSATTTATGRLLSVERKTRMGSGATLEVDYLSMITEGGEVRTIELTPGFSFRLLEKSLTSKLDRYLNIVASSREQETRKMVVSTAGSGERPLFVSYVSEVPVWKATYRIVLGGKGATDSLLQGWAIVDNIGGQDWEQVELSLVAGAPQSFVQELSRPYYARRSVVPMPQQMASVPQTHESRLYIGSGRLSGRVTDPTGATVPGATVKALDPAGALIGQTTTDAGGNYTLNCLPDGTTRLEVSMAGFRTASIPAIPISAQNPGRQDVELDVGQVSESVTVSAAAPQLQTNSSVIADRSSRPTGSGRGLGSGGRVGGVAPGVASGMGGGVGGGVYKIAGNEPVNTAAQELGDLFEYKLKEPITIHKDQSAMVPIVSSKVVAERVSLWNDTAGLQRPRRALWLTNTSGVTLDGGSVSVIDDETFAGEGIFEPIRPAEKRLLSYAVDLAVTVGTARNRQQERVTRVRVNKGTLVHTRELRETTTYTFRNEDTKPRILLVEHPVRSGWELRSETKPVETSAGSMRFRLAVDPKQTASLKVEEGMPVDASFTLSNLTSNEILTFTAQRSINASIEEALQRVVAQKAVVQSINDKGSALEEEKSAIYDDQQRLRENMKSLKGSAEERALVQRYIAQLNQQENRLAELEKEIKDLEARETAEQGALDKLIEAMSFDVNL